jgi:ornithine carbamoyltransferase
MKRFLDLADFERDEVLSLLELARRLEKQPEPHALAGRILGLVFFNPSLRTTRAGSFPPWRSYRVPMNISMW